ncbi:MAG TPA: DUF3500 domain-containing protein [Chloroflexota bacterium]|nr:DUF3500 domain-containing protein [Chloroflexota bacterium]
MATEVSRFKPRQRHPSNAREPFPLPEGLQRQMERARAGLAQPFVGITADGTPRPRLFGIRKTGVSTQPIVAAARAFLDSLTPERRAQASFELEANEWRQWSNIHPFLMRHGQLLEELDDAGRETALGVVRASLSASGYRLARDIMRLNEYIGEITGGKWDEYGEWLYWLSIFGEPSETEPWGWQLDGHHLIVNCFVLGDQVVMTPAFMGSEPVTGETGKWKGIRVFEGEESNGLRLMQALDPEQQRKAIIGDGPPYEHMAHAFRDNLVVPYAGLSWQDMNERQRELLVELIKTYTGRIRPGHAEVAFEEIEKHLPETTFAWMGRCDDDAVFYYRVHSPVILIEFDHQAGLALDDDNPNRDHIHTVVRTPNGNDYGKDLLRLHYETHPHHQANPLPSPLPEGEGTVR